MYVRFSCPCCRKPHAVGPELAGRQGRCKDCGTVMWIPGERPATEEPTSREKPAAYVGTPAQAAHRPVSPAVPASRPNPKPAPVRHPIEEVDDPYGLLDDPPSPRSQPREEYVDAGMVDEELAPLPRAGFEHWQSKKRRRVDHEPWGVSIRLAAILLWIIGFVQGFTLEMVRSGSLQDEWSYPVNLGLLVSYVFAVVSAVLSSVSLIGAAVSLAQGNRRAFSGESLLGQVCWFATIIMSVWFTGILFHVLPMPRYATWRTTASNLAAAIEQADFSGYDLVSHSDRGVLKSWDVRLSATEKADLAVYERLLDDLLDNFDRMNGLLAIPLEPRDPRLLTMQAELSDLETDGHRILSETAATPMPTRGQVKQLFDRFHERFRVTLNDLSRNFHACIEHMNLPPETEAAKYCRKADADLANRMNIYNKLYPAGATDSTGWYFALFGGASASRPSAPGRVDLQLNRIRPMPVRPNVRPLDPRRPSIRNRMPFRSRFGR